MVVATEEVRIACFVSGIESIWYQGIYMNNSVEQNKAVRLVGYFLIAFGVALAVSTPTFAAIDSGRRSPPQCDASGVSAAFGPPGARIHNIARSAHCDSMAVGTPSALSTHHSRCRRVQRRTDYGQPGLRSHRIVTTTECLD